MMTDLSPRDVLDFWFGPPDDPDHANPREAWFTKDDGFDESIRSQFGAAVDLAIDGGREDWTDGGAGNLAVILMLDQFTRNIFRGSDRSFAGDARARDLARAVVDSGNDSALTVVQRVFLYLPFEHSEDISDQYRSMELYKGLPDHPNKDNWVEYAQAHFDIIERFGRFPHRNDVLGRATTPEETEFLKGPNSSF